MHGLTLVLEVDARHPDAGAIARAGEILRGGGLVAFPTETVYGLGANALDEAAVKAIFAAKGRPANNPVIVHVSSAEQAMLLIAEWPVAAERLAERFWPGPLSLVLPKRPNVPAVVTAGADTVAIRVPDHAVALALLAAADVPIAAPSANRSMAVSPTKAEHVLKDLDGRIDALVDAGSTRGGLESTVIDLSRGRARLLRPGLISPQQIEAVIGELDRPFIWTEHLRAQSSTRALPAPGMMARHYAPQATLELAVDDGLERVLELQRIGARVGWLAIGESTAVPPGVQVVALPHEPVAYSAGLYAALHSLDDFGVERIVVAQTPQTDAWLAVRDRLRRASTV